MISFNSTHLNISHILYPNKSAKLCLSGLNIQSSKTGCNWFKSPSAITEIPSFDICGYIYSVNPVVKIENGEKRDVTLISRYNTCASLTLWNEKVKF